MVDSITPTYQQPGGVSSILNRVVTACARVGISLWGARVLYVRGRRSGEWRTTPVNLMTLDGQEYLVAPRGVTQWVRNLRAAGEGELRLGRRYERFTATEIADEDKPAVLRYYLRRWKFEVGVFFKEVGPDSPDEALLRVADQYPVFRLSR